MFDCLSFYKNLADDTRLKSLLLIAKHQTLCVCDIQTALNLSQPKVSRHLADLRKSELVIAERRGKWMYYQIHPQLPAWAKQVLALTLENSQQYLADCNSCCPVQ